MTMLRPLVACLLALILMVGSVTSAVARSEMTGMTAVTLCGTDGALTVVQIDASGQPVPMGHDCPHCLAASVLGVLGAAPVAVGPALVGTRVLPEFATDEPAAKTFAPVARGPPLAV